MSLTQMQIFGEGIVNLMITIGCWAGAISLGVVTFCGLVAALVPAQGEDSPSSKTVQVERLESDHDRFQEADLLPCPQKLSDREVAKRWSKRSRRFVG